MPTPTVSPTQSRQTTYKITDATAFVTVFGAQINASETRNITLVYMYPRPKTGEKGPVPDVGLTFIEAAATGPRVRYTPMTLPGSGTELSYQVDTYDAGNGILFCWVRIPTLTSTNVPLTFYFGSKTPSHTAATAAATWASDYKAVYHFNEASTSATVLDATSNARNAVQANTTVTNDEIHLAAGVPIPGGGYSFNGSSTSIIQNTGTNPDITGPFTISAWVYYKGTSSSDNKIVSDEFNFGHGYKLSVKNATGTENLETETRTTANPTPGNLLNAGAVTGNTWQYIQGEYNGSKFVNFINGVQVSTAIVAGAAPEAASVILMGLDHGSSGVYPDQNFYNGYMDEVRISSIAKSAGSRQQSARSSSRHCS